MTFWSAAALSLSLAALALLFRAWRRRTSGSEPSHGAGQALLGWLLLGASTVLWSIAAGWERGVALALFVPSLVAWLLVMGNREQRRRRERAEAAVQPAPRRGAPSRHVALFLVTVPLAGAASVFVAVGASRLLPVAVVDAMALVVIVVPLLWGLAAYWACADRWLWRPSLALAAGALVGAAAVYA